MWIELSRSLQVGSYKFHVPCQVRNKNPTRRNVVDTWLYFTFIGCSVFMQHLLHFLNRKLALNKWSRSFPDEKINPHNERNFNCFGSLNKKMWQVLIKHCQWTHVKDMIESHKSGIIIYEKPHNIAQDHCHVPRVQHITIAHLSITNANVKILAWSYWIWGRTILGEVNTTHLLRYVIQFSMQWII